MLMTGLVHCNTGMLFQIVNNIYSPKKSYSSRTTVYKNPAIEINNLILECLFVDLFRVGCFCVDCLRVVSLFVDCLRVASLCVDCFVADFFRVDFFRVVVLTLVLLTDVPKLVSPVC
jgi:hypothetical protein